MVKPKATKKSVSKTSKKSSKSTAKSTRMSTEDLSTKTVVQLKALAKKKEVSLEGITKKADIIAALGGQSSKKAPKKAAPKGKSKKVTKKKASDSEEVWEEKKKLTHEEKLEDLYHNARVLIASREAILDQVWKLFHPYINSFMIGAFTYQQLFDYLHGLKVIVDGKTFELKDPPMDEDLYNELNILVSINE